MSHIVRIWDLPTRLFHWLLAIAVSCSLCTAWLGGDAMAWHFRSGYLVISLLLFRLVWGFAGGYWSRWARMTRFVFQPWQVLRYARALFARHSRAPAGTGDKESNDATHADWSTGHSPLGACAVLVMLLVLVVQVSTGLISDDEITWAGPLTAWAPNAWVSAATSYHKTWGEWLIAGLIVLHLAAIAAYQVFKGQALTKPMIWGDKVLEQPQTASIDAPRNRILALVFFALCASLVAWAFLR